MPVRKREKPPAAGSLASAVHDLALSADSLAVRLDGGALAPEVAHAAERAIVEARQKIASVYMMLPHTEATKGEKR